MLILGADYSNKGAPKIAWKKEINIYPQTELWESHSLYCEHELYAMLRDTCIM